MSQNLSILSKKMAMILSVSASTGKAGVPAARRQYWSISMGQGFRFLQIIGIIRIRWFIIKYWRLWRHIRENHRKDLEDREN